MKKMGLVLFAVLALSALGFSQSANVDISQRPSEMSPGTGSVAALAPARVITLGNSVVALDGIWKFQPGDSPWVKWRAAVGGAGA